MQIDKPVADNFQLKYFPEVQTDFFHHQLADLATSNDECHLAVRVREHAPYRVAFTSQVEVAVNLADAGLGQFSSREQFRQQNFSRLHLGVRLNWIFPSIQ